MSLVFTHLSLTHPEQLPGLQAPFKVKYRIQVLYLLYYISTISFLCLGIFKYKNTTVTSACSIQYSDMRHRFVA